MENKKITIVNATGLYPPQVGGPATRSILLEKYFPAEGIKVKTVSFSSYLSKPTGIRHLFYLVNLFKTAKNSDLILAQDAASVGLPALIVSMIRKKPLAVILVGDWVWEQAVQRLGLKLTLEEFSVIRKVPKSLILSVYKWGQTLILNKASAIVVPSQYLKNIVAKWGVPAEKISVIYNPIDPINVNNSKEELRKKFGWNKKVIMSAGRNVPWKGFDLLREVVSEIPETEVFIAHTLPKEELFERILAADLFVLNTGYEGFSHSLLEVMSLGTPIITTPVGGNPELITNGQEGVLVPYNNKEALKMAIEEYFNNPTKFDAMAKKAEIKARTFTVEKMIRELAGVIRETL